MPSGSSKESSHQNKNGENEHCAFEDLDHSVLQQPLNLGVTNIKQILKCIQSGSKEVKDIILNECNVIYECKVCSGLFRSLANFIYHKRCYCKKHLCEGMLLFENFKEEEETLVLIPEAPMEKTDNYTETSNLHDCSEKTEIKMDSIDEDITIVKEVPGTSYDLLPEDEIEKELEKMESPMISRRTRDKNAQHKTKMALKSTSNEKSPVKTAKLMSATIMKKVPKKGTNTNLESKTKKKQATKLMKPPFKKPYKKILLKSIGTNPHAVYQTSDKNKFNMLNINKKIYSGAVTAKVDKEKLIMVLQKNVNQENLSSLKLGTNTTKRKELQKLSEFHLTRKKRLLSRNDCNVHELRCLTCKTQFMSLKTLYFHMLSLHSKKRLYYPCLFCNTLFVQLYGVTRHLMTIHKKTKEQVAKLREIIKNKSVWKRIDDYTTVDNPDKVMCALNTEIEKSIENFIKIEPSTIEEYPRKEQPEPQTVISLIKTAATHKCGKCGRLFNRKSSQVSHEKFCIMTPSVKEEDPDSPPPTPSKNTKPNVSFLTFPESSNATKAVTFTPFIKPQNISNLASFDSKSFIETGISARPKRGAEKQMHKDFVNSQTLKWRSANKIDTSINTKTASAVKKVKSTSLEKKVKNFIDAKSLVCTKCDKKFSSYSNLRRHVAIHVGWTRFKCKYCDYQAYNKSQCWGHVQKAHSDNNYDFDKCIVNLVSSKPEASKKKSALSKITIKAKKNSSGSVKCTNAKISSVKIPKQKNIVSSKNKNSEKKQIVMQKEQTKGQKNVAEIGPRKEIVLVEKKKSVTTTPVPKVLKREVNEDKKTKPHAVITIQKFPKKEEADNKEKKHTTIMIQKISKTEVSENKERPEHVIPIKKINTSDNKHDSNYKSVTTNNPTTIILSKRVPSTTEPSIVTISPQLSQNSSICLPVRKSEISGQEDKLITTLVARSSNLKISSIQNKLPTKSNNIEEASNNSACSGGKKERLVSKWFPKKDLCSTSRRESSAPLIIGLVPASNTGVNTQPKDADAEE